MGRNPTRSSSPKSFRLGTSVEAQCADIGFRGAWYEGKVTRTPRQKLPLYTVTYSTLFAGDSNTPKKAYVSLSFMRPRPPIELHSNDVFGLHQLVETFHNEGWWPGVVSKLPSNSDGLYSVCFPASREELVFKSSELRRSLEWVEGEWVSAEDHLLDDKEGGHVMFREGTMVEVNRGRENFGAAWFVGTVVKFIGRTYFLVQYANIKADNESCTTYQLKEIVDLQYIRPCPPVSESTSYDVLDEVEVLYEDGWYFGVVVAILPGPRYIVKFKHRKEDMTVHHTSLRPHLVWKDGQWVHISKDNDKKPGFESGGESSRPLKMKKKVNNEEEHPQLAGEIKSEIRTIRKGKHNASRRSVQRVPVLTSSNNDGEIAGKKVGEHSFEEDRSSQPCTMDGEENMICAGKLSESAKLVQTFPFNEDTARVLCGSRSDSVPEIQMVAVDPSGSSLSIVDNACNEKESSPIRLLSNVAFDEVEETEPLICEVGDNVEGRENNAITALTDPSPMESSPEEMIFSLSKFSEMSKLVEPVFNKYPQQSHFRPLLKHEKELRKGLALGLTMAFACLVTDLSNLRILDSEQDFEEKLKSLDYLEKHGFNTRPVRARLENLLKIRNSFGQLEEEKNSMATQVKELEEVNRKDNLLLSELEKSIVELQEWLRGMQEEITNLKAHVQATEERTVYFKIQFDALVNAPW